MPKITEMFAFVVADKDPEDDKILHFMLVGEYEK